MPFIDQYYVYISWCVKVKLLKDSSQYGKVKRRRSDNGGEFLSHEYESILIDNKIKHETSAPYSP